MFGPSLLVAPVTKANVSKWNTYLPDYAAGWIDFWRGGKYQGGQSVDIDVDMEKIPLFVKAGSIIPFGPVKQYTSQEEGENESLEIRIYPGADASFMIYEDEGNNYNYENGAYTEIPMTWNDAKRTLTIDARRGCYEGMLDERKFTVRMPDGSEKTVLYKGKKINVKF